MTEYSDHAAGRPASPGDPEPTVPRLTASFRRTGRLGHALRAVMALEGATEADPCKLGDLVRRSPAPDRFLAAILGDLGHRGLVASTRGSRGGYWLTRPTSEITVLQVVEALRPEQAVGPEPDGPALAPAAPGTGPVEDLWHVVDEHLRDLLGAVSLADLAVSRLPELRPVARSA